MTKPRLPKLRCPLCGVLTRSKVLDSEARPNRRAFSRRRKCLDCGGKFWTSEAVDRQKHRHI